MYSLDSPRRLEDFQYADREMADLITESMEEVEFIGVNGHISFDDSGSMTPNLAIEQQIGTIQFKI